MTTCKFNGIDHDYDESYYGTTAENIALGHMIESDPEDKEVQRKVFEYTNYQNFLRVLLAMENEKGYFRYPYAGFIRSKSTTPLTDEEYGIQQKALQELLAIEITHETIDDFATKLKDFLQQFVKHKTRLFRALYFGQTGTETQLYNDCVIQTDDAAFGTYNKFGKSWEIPQKFSLQKVMNEANVTRGGTRKHRRSKKSKRTRRR